jgi:hypothetical protein
MKRVMLFFGLFIFFIFNVNAMVGVTPAIYDVNFKPGLKQVFLFEFFSDGDSKFELYANGDLAKYVTLDKTQIIGGGKVVALLELPEEIEIPGVHRLLIGAKQIPDKGAGVFLTAEIRAVIKVTVPYPGKYAEMEFKIENANSGEDVPFTIKVMNKGKESLDTNIYLDIFSGKNKINRYEVGNYNLLSEQNLELIETLPTRDYKSGDYLAIANVDYGEKIINSEKTFSLGKLYVEIIKVTNNFREGRINPLEIEIQSFWNDPIENVYANISILNSNLSFYTPSITLTPWQTSSLVGYFDTGELNKSHFKANISAYYANHSTEKTFNMKIIKESGGINIVLVILIGLIVILVLALLLLTFWVNKLAKKISPKKK